MSYRDHTEANGEVADVSTEPCIICGALTARATLSLYGARCVGCYRKHERAGPRHDPRLAAIDEDAGGGPLAWARRILLRAQRNVAPPSRVAQEMAAQALRGRGQERDEP